MEKNVVKLGEKLYLGHPQAERLYLTNIILKCLPGDWNITLDYDSDVIVGMKFIHSSVLDESIDFSQTRTIAKTNAILFVDFDLYERFTDSDLDKLFLSCKKYHQNPDFISLEDYTSKVLKDRLSSLDNLEGLSTAEGKKYLKYFDLYEKDKKYSSKNVAYWSSISRVNLFLSAYEDVQTFTLNLGYKDDILVGIKLTLKA